MARKALPWEIIADILSRLGVKDLLRFRCVAKPWCSLIDGPDFTNLHLSRSNNGLLLENNNKLYWADSLNSLNSAVQLSVTLPGGAVISTSNGIAAIETPRGEITLLNPSTRTFSNLPFSQGSLDHPSPYRSVRRYLIGFGYDPVGDEYKLIRLSLHYTWQPLVPSSSDVRVYNLRRSQKWRKIRWFKNHSTIRGFREGSVAVNGRLHWAVDGTIAAFDLTTEECIQVPMPATVTEEETEFDGGPFHVKVAKVRGYLSVVCYYEFGFGGVGALSAVESALCAMRTDRADVWAMKSYGLKESWTKLFSVAPTAETGPLYSVIPVGYLNGDDQVLMNVDHVKMMVFQIGSGRFDDVAVTGCTDSTTKRLVASVCEESLVGVDFGSAKGHAYTKKKCYKNKKKKERRSANESGDILSEGFKLALE